MPHSNLQRLKRLRAFVGYVIHVRSPTRMGLAEPVEEMLSCCLKFFYTLLIVAHLPPVPDFVRHNHQNRLKSVQIAPFDQSVIS